MISAFTELKAFKPVVTIKCSKCYLGGQVGAGGHPERHVPLPSRVRYSFLSLSAEASKVK